MFVSRVASPANQIGRGNDWKKEVTPVTEDARLQRQQGQDADRASSIKAAILQEVEAHNGIKGTDLRRVVAKKLGVPESAVPPILTSLVRRRSVSAEYSRERGGGKIYRMPGSELPEDEDGAKTNSERRAIDALDGETTVAEVLVREPSLGRHAKEILEGLVRRGALLRGAEREGRGTYCRP
jgi:hypothetical protein